MIRKIVITTIVLLVCAITSYGDGYKYPIASSVVPSGEVRFPNGVYGDNYSIIKADKWSDGNYLKYFWSWVKRPK